jgi:hypothetical protein
MENEYNEVEETTADNEEGVAEPLIDDTEPEEIDDTEGEKTEGTEETTEPTEKEIPDVTQTKAFAQRLKEQTQKGIDAWYEEQYGESNDVHSEADYKKAMALQTEREAEEAEAKRREELEEQGYDPKYYDDLIANNKDIKEAREYNFKRKKEDFVQKDNEEFLVYFKVENGREFDGEKDILPPEIWENKTKYQDSFGSEGRSFLDAYKLHENVLLKAERAEYKKGLVNNEANNENSTSSTGSVTGNGKNVSTALTEEMVENMTPQQLSKRWNEVKELYKMK